MNCLSAKETANDGQSGRTALGTTYRREETTAESVGSVLWFVGRCLVAFFGPSARNRGGATRPLAQARRTTRGLGQAHGGFLIHSLDENRRAGQGGQGRALHRARATQDVAKWQGDHQAAQCVQRWQRHSRRAEGCLGALGRLQEAARER